jgi:hypothetical protein
LGGKDVAEVVLAIVLVVVETVLLISCRWSIRVVRDPFSGWNRWLGSREGDDVVAKAEEIEMAG